MKALVNFQPLSFNTSGEYFLIWKQISTSPEGLRSKEAAKPPPAPAPTVPSYPPPTLPPPPHTGSGLGRGQSRATWAQRTPPQVRGEPVPTRLPLR